MKTNHPIEPSAHNFLRRMVCLFFLLVALQNAHCQTASATDFNNPANCLSQTDDNRPQWQDVGLQDILFVIGQPTVPAPNTVRLPYGYTPSMHLPVLLPGQQGHPAKTGVPPDHEPKSSLYMWHFLRL